MMGHTGDASTFEDLLGCPRCAGALRRVVGGLGCERCGTAFPVFANVACAVEDPGLWRTIWLRRLDDYTSGAEARIEALRREAEAAHLLPRTRDRLLRVAAGLGQQVESVTALFEPLDTGASPLITAAIPGRSEPVEQLAILAGYEGIFRDWAWGAREHELAVEVLAPLVPERRDRVAIHGAGAGRLAVELHQRCAPGRTIAMDLDPLPLLVAGRLLAGEVVRLPEFPVEPRSDDVVVVARELAHPDPVRAGLGLVLGDPLRPPLRAGSVDVVVTTWFVDRARADLRLTAAAVNRVLAPGGVWVNIGPLRFAGELARAYTIEEVLEIAGGAAFEVTARDERDLPAFHSPASGARRTELVHAFAARKMGEAPRAAIPELVPPWVANPQALIPITPALIALGRQSMFTTGVLGMIDGTRSVGDVARELGKAWGVEAAQLQDELRAFLSRLP